MSSYATPAQSDSRRSIQLQSHIPPPFPSRAYFMSWRNQGKDPDYRFSLANERTFLAWIRTALAILAGAIILREFDSGAHRAFTVLSGALAGLACIIGAGAYWRWRSIEFAMRMNARLPVPTLVIWLAALVATFGAGLAIWLFLDLH